jgi:hypothetical protein
MRQWARHEAWRKAPAFEELAHEEPVVAEYVRWLLLPAVGHALTFTPASTPITPRSPCVPDR